MSSEDMHDLMSPRREQSLAESLWRYIVSDKTRCRSTENQNTRDRIARYLEGLDENDPALEETRRILEVIRANQRARSRYLKYLELAREAALLNESGEMSAGERKYREAIKCLPN